MKQSVFSPPIPSSTQQTRWSSLYGSSASLALSEAAIKNPRPLLVITPDMATAYQLETELQFFSPESLHKNIMVFPDWEMLPYDRFSPHQDIISQRLLTLYQMQNLKQGIVIISATTLMHRLSPLDYLSANTFIFDKGQKLDLQTFRHNLIKSGYNVVTQVLEHGEFAIRGSIIDLYPMGSETPYRIDLFGDEIDSIRIFDPETQRTIENVDQIRLLPAREYPLNENSITLFRQQWREQFNGNPANSPLYLSISEGLSAAGVEYYLPLFFQHVASFFDYLPEETLIVRYGSTQQAAEKFWLEIKERYEQLSGDIQRPILPPAQIFLTVDQVLRELKNYPQILIETAGDQNHQIEFGTQVPPQFSTTEKNRNPFQILEGWLRTLPQTRVLFCAETLGRREILLSVLKSLNIHPKEFSNWPEFLTDNSSFGLITAPLEQGLYLEEPALCLVTEFQLFGQQVMQRRLRKGREQDNEAIIRDLSELNVGDPVVHIEHGVGRYRGLQTLKTGDIEAEYLCLEYADQVKVYIPVSSLHLISRYSGHAAEHAPLTKLGTSQWDKAKRKAAEKIRDVAAELLDIYARRAMKKGFAFKNPDQDYLTFASNFPFEETPDQLQAIENVIQDMIAEKTMDRLVCGDVGFGKTEVAMRAAFMAVQSSKQVAVLVPTTLLAEQHWRNFQNRFAQWPIRVEALSRFRSKKEQDSILNSLKEGTVDIVVGTHKLLQPTIQFKNLGLLIVDEEHRFGVQQKEKIKALRAEVDLLTLTATPIPRTLNMALTSIRDLSIIATPPAKRLSVKTFVREYNKPIIREAITREILRGGQVYYLHNDIQTINKTAENLKELVPEARIEVAHAKMPEHELERKMADFYHQRFNVLVCTTIVESGIDIPTANTIIIERADKLGLAQLHQLRGRVGRSHHQAYAYLLSPPEAAITNDAVKRLNAIASLEQLGSGFILATHDLEIRGAGELLGEEQSGHMHEIGFSLYMELLDDTIKALKAGKEPSFDKPLRHGTEIDFHVPALIPESFVGDVHLRLMLYKRIANAKNNAQLDDIRAEMIDRFGLLPDAAKNLFAITQIKLLAEPLSIRKIDVGTEHGTIDFNPDANINLPVLIELIQKKSYLYQLAGKERLKFKCVSAEFEKRLEQVSEVLQKLKPDNT